ncbi:MAG: biosynthetic arginine decarboxylase [Deltaproteobacteria bacterium]|nr:MAG: biosynthetic arginine decarboxylase [Deltaproteobacteria bacterium]
MSPLSRKWTPDDADEAYGVRAWSGGYFGINAAGHLTALPGTPTEIDLHGLVREVRERGIEPPLLVRVSELLRRRVIELNEAFGRAIEEYGYQGAYRGVFPVKVNQDASVVSEVVRAGRPYHFGLEAGTKPELLVVLALLDDPEALVVCNGYKDSEYVETAIHGLRLGRRVVLVLEKATELDTVLEVAERMGSLPPLGVRLKLSSRGAGKWESSAGDTAKFGLTAHELMEVIRRLRAAGRLEALQMLHFHLGSQVSSIRSIKNALREAGRYLVECHRLGARLRYLDVGGGLGVDYDGSQTSFSSSVNYSLQEYANDVVYYTQEICDEAGVPHPDLVSESGRAVAAHHAILVTEVLGVSVMGRGPNAAEVPEGAHQVVHTLHEIHRDLSKKNYLELYHDAAYAKDEVLSLFSLGHLSLEERVSAEDLFWEIARKVLHLARDGEARLPEELEPLERVLADTYFCNFSIFQSLPDAWAVQQLFPIVPLQRLDERPLRRGVLADITCDSDGKIDRFIDRRDVKAVLPLHPLTGDPYYLGVFLVGAYQESLGDRHNLFGKVNTVLVEPGENGTYRIEQVDTGETVAEVLRGAGHRREDLLARMRRACEDALAQQAISRQDSREILRFYEQGLAGYTYLERE